jgi:hypothetical protein
MLCHVSIRPVVFPLNRAQDIGEEFLFTAEEYKFLIESQFGLHRGSGMPSFKAHAAPSSTTAKKAPLRVLEEPKGHKLNIKMAQFKKYVPDAPVIMSTSSLVMLAWRPRLYCICSRPIISPAFLDALSMALRLCNKVGSRVNDVCG